MRYVRCGPPSPAVDMLVDGVPHALNTFRQPLLGGRAIGVLLALRMWCGVMRCRLACFTKRCPGHPGNPKLAEQSANQEQRACNAPQ